MRIKVFLLSLSLFQHGIRAKEENLILSCFPCHQLRETFRWLCFFPVTLPISQHFPVSRIIVRNHSPPAKFSGDLFFRHWPYQKERLEEISNFCEGTGIKRGSTRRPRAIFRPVAASHASAREPLPGDALLPPASPDAD